MMLSPPYGSDYRAGILAATSGVVLASLRPSELDSENAVKQKSTFGEIAFHALG